MHAYHSLELELTGGRYLESTLLFYNILRVLSFKFMKILVYFYFSCFLYQLEDPYL